MNILRLLRLDQLPWISGSVATDDTIFVRDEATGVDSKAAVSQLPFPTSSDVVLKTLSGLTYTGVDLTNADAILFKRDGGSVVQTTNPNRLPDNSRYGRVVGTSSSTATGDLGVTDSVVLTTSVTVAANEVPCTLFLQANCDIECDTGLSNGTGQLAGNGAIFYGATQLSERGFCSNMFDSYVPGRSRGTFACSGLLYVTSSGTYAFTIKALGASTSWSRARNRSLHAVLIPAS